MYNNLINFNVLSVHRTLKCPKNSFSSLEAKKINEKGNPTPSVPLPPHPSPNRKKLKK